MPIVTVVNMIVYSVLCSVASLLQWFMAVKVAEVLEIMAGCIRLAEGITLKLEMHLFVKYHMAWLISSQTLLGHTCTFFS